MRIFKPKERKTKGERRRARQERTKRQEEYAEYLKSDHWKHVAQAVKARAGNRCQICNSPKQLTAHHRSYEHKGREMDHLEDLVCLCWPCHSLFHERSKINKPPKKPIAPLYLSDHLDQP